MRLAEPVEKSGISLKKNSRFNGTCLSKNTHKILLNFCAPLGAAAPARGFSQDTCRLAREGGVV